MLTDADEELCRDPGPASSLPVNQLVSPHPRVFLSPPGLTQGEAGLGWGSIGLVAWPKHWPPAHRAPGPGLLALSQGAQPATSAAWPVVSTQADPGAGK